MRKMLLVAWREFKHRVRSRGFIIGSLAVPIMLIVIWVGGGDMGAGQGEGLEQPSIPEIAETVIGYVDHANLIQSLPVYMPPGLFEAFPDEESAAAAVERGEIAAYYVVAEDYRQTGEVHRVSQDLPIMPWDQDVFDQVLVNSLFPDVDAARFSRASWPFNASQPEFVDLESGEEQNDSGFSMLPFLMAMAVMMPLFISGNYLLESVTQEKGNRVMEILLVSLRPWQMLAGKLLGLGTLTLVQYLVWIVLAAGGLLLAGRDLGTLLSGLNLTSSEVALVLPFALGGFILYAGFMAGVGALSPNIEGSRSWVFLLSLPMLVPVYVWLPIVEAPNGPLAVTLSMIPFSAPIAMMMRMTSAAVPTWQLFASLALLLFTAIGMVWLMARLFRVHTLLSGESFSLRRFVSALRSN